MAVHFIHIGKTGGTAIKTAIREAGKPDTRYGPIVLHKHGWTLRDLPPDDHAFFCLRDPIDRFMSGFYSRLRKGRPRYNYEWTPREEVAFANFSDPAELAAALARKDRAAIDAMKGIRHVNRNLHHAVGEQKFLAQHLDSVLFIARTETLTDEWPHLKDLVGLPAELELPTDAKRAHKSGNVYPDLDRKARKALKDWYAKDYKLLDYCEKVRRQRAMSV